MPTSIDSYPEEERWQIEGDVRSLKESELIKADPERLKKAMAVMGDEMEAMKATMQDVMEKKAREMFPNTNHK